MKPKNKFQKTIMENVSLLPPLSDSQKREAIRRVSPHIAKLNAKGEYTCMDCGHVWKDGKSKRTVCPHCSTKLTVETDRKQKQRFTNYFMVVTTCKGFQVLRMFLMETFLHKGKQASQWIGEAFQRWIAPDGREVIVSRTRRFMSYYYDLWNWSSDMEIRNEHYLAHRISPYKIIGHTSVIPELSRNGLKRGFHGCNPHSLIKLLLADNRIETLWKVGQFDLVRYFSKYSYLFDDNWPSIKIAIRHHYIVKDANLWYDMLSSLSYLGKDIRNPKLICPDKLKQSHDYWQKKADVKREKERLRREQERLMNEEQQYLSNIKRVTKDEKHYHKVKAKFFDLLFCDKELTIKPLMTVREFIEEGKAMRHCVFSNKYYNKDESLILHALVGGTSVATIEINLENLQVVQCRGVHNSVPPLQKRIISLIEANKMKIAKKLTA